MVRFTAVMDIRDGNPFVAVSAARAAKLKPAWRKSMPVLVTVDGKPDPPWRINLMPAGDGSFYLYLHGDVRKASGTGVGDRVRITLEFDTAYRNGPMQPLPPTFKAALAKHPKARKAWSELPPSRQKEIVRYLAHLKSEAALQRNVDKALRVLSGKAERYMARSWKDGQ